MKHLIIFVPTEVEKRYLKSSLQQYKGMMYFTYKIVVTGFGKVNAAQYCALETQEPCDAVVSCGFCGASSEFEIGDIVNPARVIDYNLTKIAETYPSLENFPVSTIDTRALIRDSTMICGDQWVGSEEYAERTAMFDKYGSLVFDMESYAIAYVAKEMNIPTIVLKVVADIVDSGDSMNQYESAPEYMTNFDALAVALNDVVSQSHF